MVDIQQQDPWAVWANSSDYVTYASDAVYTLVDGGTMPLLMDTNYDYYLTGWAIFPNTLSDIFRYRLVSLTSDKAVTVVTSGNFGLSTGASVSGADMQFIATPVPAPLGPYGPLVYYGMEILFSDSNATADITMSGYRIKRTLGV